MSQDSIPILSSFQLNDIEVTYLMNQTGQVGLRMIPSSLRDRVTDNNRISEPLVQLHIRGDRFAGRAVNGFSLSDTDSSRGMHYKDQTVENTGGTTVIRTVMEDDRNYRVTHILTYRAGDRAFSVQTIFENGSDTSLTLEHLSAFALGGLTPFGGRRETDRLKLHRAKSWWSAEGRIVTDEIGRAHV